MKKHLLPVLLGLATLALLPVAAAESNSSAHQTSDFLGANFEDAHDEFFLWYAKELGLSEAQVDKLNKVRNDAQDDRKKIWRSLYKSRAELHDLMHQKDPSEKKLDERAERIGHLQGELIKLRARTVLKEKQVLTKAQLKKFDKLMMTPQPGEEEPKPETPAKK